MPTDEDVEKAIETFSGYAGYKHFFDSIKSPDWIEPLVSKGFFVDPPSAIRSGDYVQFPAWPESEYLIRVATAAPEKVFKIVKELTPTDNPRVYEDVIDIALIPH